MDTTQWSQQDIGVKSMAAEIAPNNVITCSRPGTLEKKRPDKDQAVNCPRCNSTNTKFCYYNNYSLTQPRYFCKTCRRYWTEGGTLRNVPVGGGSRKNRRSSSVNNSSSTSQKLPDLNPNPNVSHHNPDKINIVGRNQDLNLGFQTYEAHDHGAPHQFLEWSKMESGNNGNNHLGGTPISALELLRTGIASKGFTSFISTPAPDLNALYPLGFPFHDLKPPACSTDHAAAALSNYANGVQENGGARIMFPLGRLNQLPGTSEVGNHQQTKKGQENSTAGYWNGMLGGGPW